MLETSKNIKQTLFKTFYDDHAVLGGGFHELRQAIAINDVHKAQEVAKKIDRESGAHIAFEENDFYPALDPFLSPDEVTAMYELHDKGHALLVSIINSDEKKSFSRQQQSHFIETVKAMEHHISACGKLFDVIGLLPQTQQKDMLNYLEEWRQKAPRWTTLRKPAQNRD